MSMGMNISAGTIMAYMDLDMSSFNSAIDMAGEQLSGFASGGVADALGSIGAAAETAGRALTMHITGKLLDVGQAALQVGMNFDASMSNVYGLMSSLNLSQAQMDALRDTAREMGATTKFSASEAADAMGYMALAGWDDAQVIAGIPGVLNLAAAANMDLAKASDIVTDTMTPFGMAAERAGEAADVFAYAQANSNTTVEALGEAMKYAAPTADAFGMTLQDTAAAMGVLANAGIKGSQGGTTLNAMLRDMKNNAKNGAIAIGKTKVALTNADGSYRSYAAIIRDIDKATSSMTASQRDAALGAIFGDESLKGILATLKQGPDALDAMTEGMYACGGAAEDMAATMGDNLKGDLAILESGAQDMAIALSDWLMPAARGVVQGVTDLIGKFNTLDDGTKNTIFRIGAMAAAAGPLLLNGGKVLTLLSGVNPLVVGLGAAAALAYTHSDALQGMVAKLGDGVTAFGAALESGAGFTAAFSAGLTAAFGEEAAGKVLGAIEGIKTAISTVGDVLTTVTDAVGTFFGALFDGEGLKQSWDNAAAVISGYDWTALGTSILSGVTGTLDAAGSWLSSLFGLGKSAAEGLPWSEVGTAIQTGVGTVLDAAGSWLYAGFEAAKTYIGNLNWGEVGTAIQTGVGMVLDTAGTWLSSGFEAAKTAISGIDWGCVGSTISSGISGAIDGLAKLGSGIWDTITGWFGGGDEEKAKGDAKTSGGNLTTGMETGLTEGSAAVTTAATNAASSAMTAAAQTLTAESGTTITETWVGGMVTGIANQNPILTLGVQTLGDNAVTTATDTLTADAGKTIANSFVGGICSAVAVAGPILNVQMQTTADNAAAKAGAALSYTQGYDIGVNMVRGITAGVRSTSGELYSQMVQMARTAVSRTKNALRIHSPSGVFADEVGAWIPGGIGEGVLSREDDALGPLEEVRASMVDTMTGALSGIDTGWPDAPWNPGGGGGRTVTVTINVTGDWHVRSEQEKQEIISELGERVREELRGL